jgi:acyl-CoA thioesterase
MIDKYEVLARKFDESPYAVLLGMKVVEVSEGRALISLKVDSRFNNWVNLTHGGLIMSVADQAFGCALNTLDRIYVAAQFNINFLIPPKDGELIYAEGRVLRAGKRSGLGEMTVRDANGKLIATATGTVISLGERKD